MRRSSGDQSPDNLLAVRATEERALRIVPHLAGERRTIRFRHVGEIGRD
jgi:hypothetical protein